MIIYFDHILKFLKNYYSLYIKNFVKYLNNWKNKWLFIIEKRIIFI